MCISAAGKVHCRNIEMIKEIDWTYEMLEMRWECRSSFNLTSPLVSETRCRRCFKALRERQYDFSVANWQ